MRNIYLIGFMGAGKSMIARALVKKTGAESAEMDELIERQQGMAITEIFQKYGEEHFRNLETELLRSLAEKTDLIVSCGGGSVLRDENAALMKENGCIVLLTAAPETIYERVKDSKNRPVLNGNMNVAYIRELMEKRRARYEAVADIRIATDGKDADTICEEILAQPCCGR
ncbi:MAG: shikimate kinase [Roseburia sp.]|nr:shikimate kinase [Roseburia sp.]